MTESGDGAFACTPGVQTITGFHALYTEQKMGELRYQGLNGRCADWRVFSSKVQECLERIVICSIMKL